MTATPFTPYEPGERYEFLVRTQHDGFALAYRCFRGSCRGHSAWVVDRNSHNRYHNDLEAADAAR